MEGNLTMACLALAVNPIVGEWEPAVKLMEAFVDRDPGHLGYLRESGGVHMGSLSASANTRGT